MLLTHTTASEVDLLDPDPIFVGRESELSGAAQALEDHRLVTLVGPPGIGKTRLAQRLGDRLTLPHVFVDLMGATGREDVGAAVAGSLGIPSAPAPQLERRVAEALRQGGPRLVILDNFETVAATASDLVLEWLTAVPTARWLVTSRIALRLRAEFRVTVPPLSEPEAAELFRRRIVAGGVEALAEIAPDGPLVQELMARLEGIPLAIELAAGRASVLGLDQLVERLSQTTKVLRSPYRDGSPRHVTLERSIAASWELLSPWEQSVLGQCSIFRGGFDVPAAEAVVDLSSHPQAPPTVDVLQALVAASLLRRSRPGGAGAGSRFRFFEAIREFALHAAEETPAMVEATQRRHARHFTQPFVDGRQFDPAVSPGPDAQTRLAPQPGQCPHSAPSHAPPPP